MAKLMRTSRFKRSLYLLAGFALLVAILGVYLNMLAEARAQRAALAWLVERGGGYYEHDETPKRFGNLVGLTYPADKIRVIKGAERADWGNVPGWKCADDDLQILSCFANLEELYLSGPGVTDEGVANLQHVPWLTALELWRTAVTDGGLSVLRELPALKSLDLTGTKITDKAMAILSHLKSLQSLDLSETEISESGVSKLVELKDLERLILGETLVGDNAFREFANLENLTYLFLYRTAITDACVNDLAKIRSLEQLNIHDCDVSQEAIKSLQMALPNCNIIY